MQTESNLPWGWAPVNAWAAYWHFRSLRTPFEWLPMAYADWLSLHRELSAMCNGSFALMAHHVDSPRIRHLAKLLAL